MIERIPNAYEIPNVAAVDVRTFGAKGDGTTDDTAAIQAALNAKLRVLIPPGTYKITAPLVPRTNQHIIGAGFQDNNRSGTGKTIIHSGTLVDAAIKPASGTHSVTIDGIVLQGNAAAGARGIDVVSGNRWTIRDCHVNGYGEEGIRIQAGVVPIITNCLTTNCLLANRATRSAYAGSVDIGASDAFVHHNEFTASSTGWLTGYVCSMVVRGNNGFFSHNMFETDETGIYVASGALQNGFYGNRADLNYGHGWVIDAYEGLYIGNRAYRNSRAAHNTYDGFYLPTGAGHTCLFVGNTAYGRPEDVIRMRYGFNEMGGPSTDTFTNQFYGNRVANVGTANYNIQQGHAGIMAFDESDTRNWKNTRGKIIASTGIGVGNSAAATTLGSVTKKIEVFDASGASLGFIPVYGSIT